MRVQAHSEAANWLTGGDSGTLTEEGLQSILGACEELNVRPRACASRIVNRTRPFETMRDEAAAEAALLLRECSASQTLGECRQDIEDARYVRDQNIGLAEPATLQMRQSERIDWLVSIKSTDLGFDPGRRNITVPSPTEADPDRRARVENAIVYTENTCFVLEYDPQEFDVAADRSCPEYRGGSIPYTAKWKVKPLKSGERQISISAVYVRDGREFATATVPPSPFKIEVEDWKIAWIKDLELWQQLLAAVGLIFTTVMGWKIWQLFRGRNKSGPGEA